MLSYYLNYDLCAFILLTMAYNGQLQVTLISEAFKIRFMYLKCVLLIPVLCICITFEPLDLVFKCFPTSTKLPMLLFMWITWPHFTPTPVNLQSFAPSLMSIWYCLSLIVRPIEITRPLKPSDQLTQAMWLHLCPLCFVQSLINGFCYCRWKHTHISTSSGWQRNFTPVFFFFCSQCRKRKSMSTL